MKFNQYKTFHYLFYFRQRYLYRLPKEPSGTRYRLCTSQWNFSTTRDDWYSLHRDMSTGDLHLYRDYGLHWNITPNFEYTTWITKSKDNDDDIDDAPLTTEFYPRPTPRIRKQKTLPTTNIISTTSSLPYAKNTFRPIKVPQKSSFTTDKQLSANLTTFSFKEEQQTTIHPDISAIKNVGFSMLITGVICLILAICLILSLIVLNFCEILCCKKKKRSRKRSRSCELTKPQMTCLTPSNS